MCKYFDFPPFISWELSSVKMCQNMFFIFAFFLTTAIKPWVSFSFVWIEGTLFLFAIGTDGQEVVTFRLGL
jgi:hypothetical protein